MTVRVLKIWPQDEKFLRTKSKEVEMESVLVENDDMHYAVPDHVVMLIDDMIDTLYTHRAAGISAPQVGEHLRVVVLLDHQGEPMALINPVIEEKGEELLTSNEGCLSFPGVFETIGKTRSAEVVVTGVNSHGETVRYVLDDAQAIAIQHEIDHLDGVLFVDHMSALKRRYATKRVTKIQKRVDRAREAMEKSLKAQAKSARLQAPAMPTEDEDMPEEATPAA